jgi:hypothetical protein
MRGILAFWKMIVEEDECRGGRMWRRMNVEEDELQRRMNVEEDKLRRRTNCGVGHLWGGVEEDLGTGSAEKEVEEVRRAER